MKNLYSFYKALACTAMVALYAVPAGAQKVTAEYVTNGAVATVLEKDKKIYVGGNFTEIGKYANWNACIDEVKGKLLRGKTLRSDNMIQTAIDDGKGGFYIGGYFNYINDTLARGLAHIKADGSIDPSFNFTLKTAYGDGSARYLFMMGDTLFVSGFFDSANGQQRKGILGINTKTNTLMNWAPLVGGNIESIVCNKDYVCMGGNFSYYNDFRLSNFVKLKRSDLSYLHAIGYDNIISKLVTDSSRVVAKGSFSSAGWMNTGVLLIDTLNMERAILAIQLNGYASKIVPDPKGGWFVAGEFTLDKYPAIKNLLRLKPDYGLDTFFKFTCDRAISDIVVLDSFLYCAAENVNINGQYYSQLGVINHVLNKVKAMPLNFKGIGYIRNLYTYKNQLIIKTVSEQLRFRMPGFVKLDLPLGDYDVKPDSQYLYMTNGYGYVSMGNAQITRFKNNGRYQQNMAKQYLSECNAVISDGNGGWFVAGNGIRHILADGSLDTKIQFDFQQRTAECLLKRGDSLFVGGSFHNLIDLNTFSSSAISNFAIINIRTGAIGAFATNINKQLPSNYNDGNVKQMTIVGDSLLLAGYISVTGTSTYTSYNNFLKISLSTFGMSGSTTRFDNTVYAMCQADSFIYYGGYFKQVNGVQRPGVCRINKYTNQLDAWNPALDTTSAIHEISADDRYVYLASRTFNALNYNINQYFIRTDRHSAVVIPYAHGLDSAFSSISTFAIQRIRSQKDTVYIGGLFQRNIGNANLRNFIKFNRITGVVYPLDIDYNGPISHLEPLSNGQLELGGLVNDIERQNNALIARYDLEKNMLDTWKVHFYTSWPLIGKPFFDINNRGIYFGQSSYNNTEIDGIKRNLVFRANKTDGSISSFDARLPYNYQTVAGIKCIGKQVYMLINQSFANSLYKISEGRDSFRQVVNVQGGNNSVKIENGLNDLPFIAGNYVRYAVSQGNRSYNTYSGLFEKGMNDYPGTFTPNSTNSSVFYNYRDSVYYLFESNSSVNALGGIGSFYRVIPSTGAVKRLDFSYTQGIKGMYRKDSSLYVFGTFANIYDKTTYRTLAHVFKHNEKRDRLDLRFNPRVNNTVSSVISAGNALMMTGEFTIIGKESRVNLCAIDLAADTITAYDPQPNSSVRQIVAYDTAIVISGDFYNTRFGAASGAAILDTRKGQTIHNVNFYTSVYSIALNGYYLYLGGNFTNFKSSGIDNLVRYNLKTRQVDGWNPKVAGAVNKVIADDSFVYAAGNFTNVNNSKQLYYGRFRTDNGANMPLSFKLTAPDSRADYEGYATGLFMTDRLVYVSGYFKLDQKRRGLIAIDKKTHIPTNYRVDFGEQDNGYFSDIVQYDDKLLTNTPDTLNGVFGGNIMMLDRFQPIAYPALPGPFTIKGSAKMSSSERAIYMGNTAGGVHYIMNRSMAGGLLILEKDSSDKTAYLASYTPHISGNKGKVSLTLRGNMFSSGDVVYLVKGKDTLWCDHVSVTDRNLLYAHFVFDDDSVGLYTLHIRMVSGMTLVSASAYTLVKPEQPDIRTSIIGYGQVRPNRWYDYLLKVENKTNTDLANVPVFFTIQTNGKAEQEAVNLYSDSFMLSTVDTVDGHGYKGKLYSFLLPELRTKQIVSIPVRIKIPSGDSLAVHFWHQLPLDNPGRVSCLQQIWKKFSGTAITANCIGGSLLTLDSIFGNTEEDVFGRSSTISDYHGFYKRTTASCGGTYAAAHLAALNRFYAHPVLMAGIDPVCYYNEGNPSLDSALILPVKPGRFVIRVVKSLDPNDKIGPVGYSGNNVMNELPGTFNYVIRFENDSTATAAAQNIIIKDTIDTRYFDIRQVSFSAFKVGDYKYFFPANTASVNRNFDFREKAGLVLNLRTDVDTAKGIITWHFSSLDITTLTTEKLNPVYGFLPPNNKTGRGEGSVSFEIALKPFVGGFADIKNRADIVFDDNKSILTPYWHVTRDAVAPISAVLPLANPVNALSFPVQWQGQDPSGIRHIEVFVSTDNVVYSLWKTSRSDSSAMYTGKKDTTYYFYSLATDVIGNKEAIPSVFDASTQVKLLHIVEQSAPKPYRMYPNPGRGLLNFHIEGHQDITLKVYSMEGKLISTIDCPDADMRFMITQRGIFIVEVCSGTEVIGTEKVVVD
jgi:hypothetical protein